MNIEITFRSCSGGQVVSRKHSIFRPLSFQMCIQVLTVINIFLGKLAANVVVVAPLLDLHDVLKCVQEKRIMKLGHIPIVKLRTN